MQQLRAKLPSSWRKSTFVRIQDDVSVVHVNSSARQILVYSDHEIPCADILRIFDRHMFDSSFQLNVPIYYFEIELLSTVESSSGLAGVTIGLVVNRNITPHSSVRPNSLPGRIDGSIGFHSSGSIYLNGTEIKQNHKFGTMDIVGCGWEIGGESRVIFTCNKKIVYISNCSFGSIGESCFPSIGLEEMGTSIKANFGSNDFQFSTDSKFCISNHSTTLLNAYMTMSTSTIDTTTTPNNNNTILNNQNLLSPRLYYEEDEDIMLNIASEMSIADHLEVLSTWCETDKKEAIENIQLIDTIITDQFQRISQGQFGIRHIPGIYNIYLI